MIVIRRLVSSSIAFKAEAEPVTEHLSRWPLLVFSGSRAKFAVVWLEAQLQIVCCCQTPGAGVEPAASPAADSFQIPCLQPATISA